MFLFIQSSVKLVQQVHGKVFRHEKIRRAIIRASGGSLVKSRVCWFSLFFATFLLLAPAPKCQQTPHSPAADPLDWVRNPPKNLIEYDYVMTVRVRLLLFWVGKDDVGGGYVRRGISSEDPREEMFQVLFGSEPAKTPRAINRWGAGTEAVWHQNAVESSFKADDVVSSAFLGFMKPSRGKSASEMQGELKKEKEQGTYIFTGIVSRAEPGRVTSLIVPLQSQTDYNLHQYDEAQPIMLSRIAASDRPLKTLQSPASCPRAGQFLGTVSELLDAALDGRKAPFSLCYLYDAEEDLLTVERTELLPKLPVQLHGAKGVTLLDTEYQNILQLDFLNTNKTTGRKVNFSILVGTQGPLRGIPVQIRYQPNWWFQIVLNLRNLPAPPLAVREKAAPQPFSTPYRRPPATPPSPRSKDIASTGKFSVRPSGSPFPWPQKYSAQIFADSGRTTGTTNSAPAP
jgi:hypothetical protein